MRGSARRDVVISGAHASHVLDLPADRAMRVVVVADTHSAPHPKAEKLIRQLEADAIVHAGDIGDLAVLERLAAIAPLFAVRGNIDTKTATPPASLDLEFRAPERGAILKAYVTHIAVYGPKLRADVFRKAKDVGARLVLCGHSHVPFIGTDKGMTLFNPGSIGPRRFSLPITLGVLEISPTRIGLRHVSCETGQNWLP